MSDDAQEPRPRRPRRTPGPDDGSVFQPSRTPPENPARPGAKNPAAPRERKPQEQSGGPGLLERFFFGSVGTAHKAVFCRQAAAYLDAGVDLFKALGALQKQFERTALGPVLGRVQQAIRRGETLSGAMASESAAFDPMFLSMMQVAEARGAVPETLRRMSTQYEARLRLMRQARAGLIYPVAVVLIMAVVIWLLTAFVLPGLVDMISSMTRGGKASLPLPTRVLMAVSGFMKWIGWWAVPLSLVAAAVLARRWYRTAAGKALLDAIVLHVPVLGRLVSKLDTARFARNLGALLDAGVDLPTGLDLTAGVIQNATYRRAVQSLRPQVVEGHELLPAMTATRVFAPDALAYVETGESTGKLPESLDKLADEYEEQVEYIVKNLGQLVQPLIVIVLGGFVLLVALAFVLAYIQMITGLSNGGF